MKLSTIHVSNPSLLLHNSASSFVIIPKEMTKWTMLDRMDSYSVSMSHDSSVALCGADLDKLLFPPLLIVWTRHMGGGRIFHAHAKAMQDQDPINGNPKPKWPSHFSPSLIFVEFKEAQKARHGGDRTGGDLTNFRTHKEEIKEGRKGKNGEQNEHACVDGAPRSLDPVLQHSDNACGRQFTRVGRPARRCDSLLHLGSQRDLCRGRHSRYEFFTNICILFLFSSRPTKDFWSITLVYASYSSIKFCFIVFKLYWKVTIIMKSSRLILWTMIHPST